MKSKITGGERGEKRSPETCTMKGRENKVCVCRKVPRKKRAEDKGEK